MGRSLSGGVFHMAFQPLLDLPLVEREAADREAPEHQRRPCPSLVRSVDRRRQRGVCCWAGLCRWWLWRLWERPRLLPTACCSSRTPAPAPGQRAHEATGQGARGSGGGGTASDHPAQLAWPLAAGVATSLSLSRGWKRGRILADHAILFLLIATTRTRTTDKPGTVTHIGHEWILLLHADIVQWAPIPPSPAHQREPGRPAQSPSVLSSNGPLTRRPGIVDFAASTVCS